MSTSYAVRQFVDLIRGERPRKAPYNPFKTALLLREDRYCLRCCHTQIHDVAYSESATPGFVLERLIICRVCGLWDYHTDLVGKLRRIGGPDESH